MAPDWAGASRPLVAIFTLVAFAITLIFRADVDAQGGAYATGVLVLMSSASVAVTLSAVRRRRRGEALMFGAITLVFAYTTVVNVIERPDGVRIASVFIAAIVLTSLVSRVYRTTELRVDRVELDERARRFLLEEARGEVHVIMNRRQAGDAREYELKDRDQRLDHRIPPGEPVLFLEVDISDASDFSDALEVRGFEVAGEDGACYRVLRAEAPAVPNAIAAFLLHARDETGKVPNAYFTWSEGNPLKFLMRYVLFGEGDTAPVTHEILRQNEPDPERRPFLHVGG
jgi:hypothetical protein